MLVNLQVVPLAEAIASVTTLTCLDVFYRPDPADDSVSGRTHFARRLVPVLPRLVHLRALGMDRLISFHSSGLDLCKVLQTLSSLCYLSVAESLLDSDRTARLCRLTGCVPSSMDMTRDDNGSRTPQCEK